MTPTEKQKTIAEQAVYGDLQLNRRAYDDVQEKYIMEVVDSKWVLDFINYDKLLSLTPILRPLSDLTREITHKGYNDDKPFVPMLDWAKKRYPKYRKYEIIDRGVTCDDAPAGDTSWARCSIGYGLKSNEESDYLNMLHFDTRNLIDNGDAIDVNTLEVNPYEV